MAGRAGVASIWRSCAVISARSWSYGGSFASTAYLTLADAIALQTEMGPADQRLQVARGGGAAKSASVAAVIVRITPGADVDLLTATLRQWKHLSALSQAEQEEILLASVVDRARRQIGLFLGILLAVSAVVARSAR